jgi:hypothetical protein
MKPIFKLLIILVICLVGIGIWRGWFSFSISSGDTEKDKVNVGVSVDKGKMKEDVQKAKTKVAEEVKEAVEKVKEKEGK